MSPPTTPPDPTNPDLTPFITAASITYTTTMKAIADPLGYGYPGRVAVPRSMSLRQPESSGFVAFWIAEGKPVPTYTRLLYLVEHGFYSIQEIKLHPFYLESLSEEERAGLSGLAEPEIEAEEEKKLDNLVEKFSELQVALRDFGDGAEDKGLGRMMEIMNGVLGPGQGAKLNEIVEALIGDMMLEDSMGESDEEDETEGVEKKEVEKK